MIELERFVVEGDGRVVVVGGELVGGLVDVRRDLGLRLLRLLLLSLLLLLLLPELDLLLGALDPAYEARGPRVPRRQAAGLIRFAARRREVTLGQRGLARPDVALRLLALERVLDDPGRVLVARVFEEGLLGRGHRLVVVAVPEGRLRGAEGGRGLALRFVEGGGRGGGGRRGQGRGGRLRGRGGRRRGRGRDGGGGNLRLLLGLQVDVAPGAREGGGEHAKDDVEDGAAARGGRRGPWHRTGLGPRRPHHRGRKAAAHLGGGQGLALGPHARAEHGGGGRALARGARGARGRRAGPLPLARAEVHGGPVRLSLVAGDEGGPRRVGHGHGARGGRLEVDEGLQCMLPGGRGDVGLQELPQRHRELVRRLVAVVEVLGQGLLEDGEERVVLLARGDEVEVRLLVGDLVEDRHEVVGVEGPLAREQLEEHAAHAEEVAAPVDLGPLHLLGRHVVGGAHDVAGARHGGGGEAGHPEVHDLHRAVLVDEDVRGLDVAVNDALLVRVGQAGQHRGDDRDLALHVEGGLAAHGLLEVLALQELHGDVGRAIGVVVEVENRDHVGMGHLGHGLRFALEALLQLGVVGDARDHDLQGHVAVELGVAGEVHHAHGALAQRMLDVVLADAPRELFDLGRRGGRVRLVIRSLAHGARSGRTLTLRGLWPLEDKPRRVSTLQGAGAAPSLGGRRLAYTKSVAYLAFPETVGLARRLRNQQSSRASWQTWISLP